MSANIFGQRLHGHVHAQGKRVQINAGGPGVIQYGQRAVLMRGLRDGGQVLHFHGDRSRTLTPHQPRVRLELRADACARVRRIITHFNAKAPQHAIGKHSVGPVNTFRQQHVVTGFEQRQVDQRDCRLSAGSDKRAKTFFQFADFGRQFQRGGRAVKPIGIADLKLVPAVAGLGRMFKHHGRSAIDRRRQRAKAFRHGSVRMNELGLPVFLIGHAGDCKAKRLAWTVSKVAQTLR